jgi:hypothetical protein
MRLAIIETNDKAQVLLELSEDEFIKKLKKYFEETGSIEDAFRLVAKELKDLTIKL